MVCGLMLSGPDFKNQEGQMAYGKADEALSTVLVMFKKMFLVFVL